MDEIFDRARKASVELLALSAGRRDAFLSKLSEKLVARMDEILSANASDLLKMDRDNPLYDRLLLDEKRFRAIASDMARVAALPDPLSRQLESRVLSNGLELRKVPVPFGLIGIIYEARPNVTFDVFSLCFKSGNACLLKGGRDADSSNRAGVRIIRETLAEDGLNPDCVNLLPAGHEAAAALLNAVGKVDLVIPRGGRRLIDFVRDNAKVPYIETGAGVVHAYFDESADIEKGRRIVNNAKTRRVSVCNALDCLIINEKRLKDLPALCEPLAASNVEIYADDAAFKALEGRYGAPLHHAVEESFGTEYLSYRMALKTVPDIGAAISHISRFGSGHSECIITESQAAAALFERDVDAGCIYVNAPTSFTDGAQFGMGAEIGISTQKLGARGPMALNELTTYKWLVRGNGQTRG